MDTILSVIEGLPMEAMLGIVGIVGIAVGILLGRVTKNPPPPVRTPTPKPNFVVVVTEYPRVDGTKLHGDKITVTVKGDSYFSPPPGFREIPAGQSNLRIFTRELGQTKLNEIKETLEVWLARASSGLSLYNLEAGSTFQVIQAKIT